MMPHSRTKAVVAAFATLAVGIALPACTSRATATWSPAKIDAVAQSCREHPFKPQSVSPGEGIAVPMQGKPAGAGVVVYGASWCPACSNTAAYLTQRGIPFVERDVERDEAAAMARLMALHEAGLPPRQTLPVVDARGTVTLGFFPCVVEEAWAAP
jgi:glutaredoxin